MLSKNRRTRTSLKNGATNASSSNRTKEKSPVIANGSSTTHSANFLTSMNSTSTNTTTQKSTTNGTSNNGNGRFGRRIMNFLRWTTGRPNSSVRFSRQRDSMICSSSKSGPNTSNNAFNDNHISSNVVKDETLESNVPSTNDHIVNIISSNDPTALQTCALCYHDYESDQFERLTQCSHAYCRTCLKSYLKLEITEGRVTLNCPDTDCPERIHPCDITRILQKNSDLVSKYEQFMVRRVLQSIADTRWCPAPDCGFAVIASGYASCPEIQCLRPGCNTSFCYHCKAVWHPNKTCEDAAREKTSGRVRSGSFISLASGQQRDEIKQCPRCHASILKMDDGSCNHMTCPICEAEFCWLCGREISDLHYLSPSGCTFWGKKQWSRKKVILWQVATLIGAPVIIALIAGVAVPSVIIGVPIWAGRRIFKKFNKQPHSKLKRNILVALGVVGSIIVSPIIATLAVGIGVPILLAYVYGVIPISLCRTGGCGIGTRNEASDGDGPNIDNFLPFSLREVPIARTILNDNQSVMTHPTIGGDSASLSNSVVQLVEERSQDTSKMAHEVGTASIMENLTPNHRLEVQAEVSDCKNFDIESITISEKSSKTMDSLKVLAGSIKDACVVHGLENSGDPVDSHGRKLSLLSSASDYSRSIQSDGQAAGIHRSSSPCGDKTVSFFDERNKSKTKVSSDRF